MNKPIAWHTPILLVLVLVSGCASNSIPTRYYSLTPLEPAAATGDGIAETISLGVGPLQLPEMLDRRGIVSFRKGNELSIATYNIWAGDLQEAILRVLTDNMSSQLGNDRIWSFPWDNRNRPEYQLRIVIEEFSGQLRESVTLRAKWSLLGEHGRKELLTRRSSHQQRVSGKGYRDYVGALNGALNEFSQALASQVSEALREQAGPALTSMEPQ